MIGLTPNPILACSRNRQDLKMFWKREREWAFQRFFELSTVNCAASYFRFCTNTERESSSNTLGKDQRKSNEEKIWVPLSLTLSLFLPQLQRNTNTNCVEKTLDTQQQLSTQKRSYFICRSTNQQFFSAIFIFIHFGCILNHQIFTMTIFLSHKYYLKILPALTWCHKIRSHAKEVQSGSSEEMTQNWGWGRRCRWNNVNQEDLF